MSSGKFQRLWLGPLGLAVLSLFGLVAALLGDGVWNIAGYLSLLAPALIGLTLCCGLSLGSDTESGAENV